MEPPLVSIIVNCYNSARFLKPTIDSILNQTFSDFEVIFWDNQSTDDTAKIINTFKDSRFKYYFAPVHVSLGEARNCAIEKVSGKYLTFLDSDDIWLPDFLKRAVTFLQDGHYSFYYSNYFNWIESKSQIINNSDGHSGARIFGDLLSNYHVGMSAAVVDYDLVRKHSLRFNNAYELIEDYDFFLRLSRLGSAYYDAEPLMKYRMHEASLTNSSKKNWAIEFDRLHHDLTTNILDPLEQKRYSKQLRWLKVRSINARAEELIRDGNRMSLLKLIFKNCLLDIKILFPLTYLFMTKENYYKLKSKLQKTSYHTS